jgi:hypothetical protein
LGAQAVKEVEEEDEEEAAASRGRRASFSMTSVILDDE